MTPTPALLGGEPAFDPALAFARPTLEQPGKILSRIEESLLTGRLTDGPLVRTLEERAAEMWGVSHCVAVSSGTVGLMLVIQALGVTGAVLVPSFTFSATAHAAAWNGLPVRFADCDPDTWCLSPDKITPDVSLIMGVHLSGVACDVGALEEVARSGGCELIFDAAHGSGTLASSADGPVPVGRFGHAEVFSLTPTKVLSGTEGGLVTTDDGDLADHLRIARNYGNPGDYDSRFPGINARLSELHAAVALASMEQLEERVIRRNTLADRYRQALGDLPGIRFQHVPTGSRSSYKDFTILVDQHGFGASRDAVRAALQAEGVETRTYYAPPVHLQQAYIEAERPLLPVTERLADQVLTLPMWSHLPESHIDRIGAAVHDIQHHAEAVEARAST